MILVCPENRALSLEKQYGLFLYRHADDRSLCEYLNMFDVSPDAVLKRYLLSHTFECDPGVIAAFRSSASARADLCRELSQEPADTLVIKLEHMYSFCEKMENWFLTEELHQEFGYVWYENLKIATGHNFIPGVYRRVAKTPNWPMVQLNESHSKIGRAGSLAQKIQETTKRQAEEVYRQLAAEQLSLARKKRR